MDKKTIKRLLTYCKPYRFLIMLLTLLSIVSVVFTLLTPVLIGQAIDLLVGKNQVHFQALLKKEAPRAPAAPEGERHGGASDAAGHCGWVLLQGVPGREPCSLRWL